MSPFKSSQLAPNLTTSGFLFSRSTFDETARNWRRTWAKLTVPPLPGSGAVLKVGIFLVIIKVTQTADFTPCAPLSNFHYPIQPHIRPVKIHRALIPAFDGLEHLLNRIDYPVTHHQPLITIYQGKATLFILYFILRVQNRRNVATMAIFRWHWRSCVLKTRYQNFDSACQVSRRDNKKAFTCNKERYYARLPQKTEKP